MKRLALLCGAGISVPVGMPRTQDITSIVLSGKNIARHTDMTYYPHEPIDDDKFSAIDRESPARVCAFLDILKRECDRFYRCDKSDQENKWWYKSFGKHTTNYEDLYYLAVQLHDSDTHEFENPAVQPFIEKLLGMDNVKRIMAGEDEYSSDPWGIAKLLLETCNYIRSIASTLLNSRPKTLDPLKTICDACEDRRFVRVDVYTLNHDNVLEAALLDSGIGYADGFSEPINEVRYWEPRLLDSQNARVCILKLHGGVNWYWFTPPGRLGRLGIPVCRDIDHTISPEGVMQRASALPDMLMGTFNKLMSYTVGPYVDLHLRFFTRLNEVDKLVIVGYGFGDKGINQRVLTWLAEPDHKAVVIEPNPDTLNLYARGAVRMNWKYLRDAGKLVHIEKGIQETTWEEIRGHLEE